MMPLFKHDERMYIICFIVKPTYLQLIIIIKVKTNVRQQTIACHKRIFYILYV